MQLSNHKHTIDSANVGETANFTISQNSQAFKILSDGLYSDRIMAIVRELGCNAVDSHKAIGSVEPFEVKLPSVIDPTFYVKDFGIGLSREQVLNLFSTYFMSSKCDDNSLTGGFGLGSKAPFSYTDSFSVVSIYDGEKSTYNAYISEDGCPKIAVMCSESTTDHNGVTISFTVKRSDYNEFCEKLGKVVTYFDIKPRVIGNSCYKATEVKYTQRGAQWGLRETKYYTREYAKVIMGGVAYPIDSNSFSDDNQDTYYSLIHSPIDIFLNIGDVAINPSREALNYRKSDVTHLKEIFDVIIKDISKIIQDKVLAKTTVWDAVVELDNIYNSSAISQIVNLSRFNINGTEVRYGWTNSVVVPDNMYMEYFSISRKSRDGVIRAQQNTSIDPDNKTIIVYNDLPRGGKSRLIHYREKNECRVYFVSHSGALNTIAPTVKQISDLFFGAPVMLASSMPLAPRHTSKGSGAAYGFKRVELNEQIGTTYLETLMVKKSEIQSIIYDHIKSGTDIVLIRQCEDLKARYANIIERPLNGTVNFSSFKTALGQLCNDVKFKKTVFIYVKNDSILHKFIKKIAPLAMTLDEWSIDVFVPLVASDINNNKNNVFSLKSDMGLIKSTDEMKQIYTFMETYAQIKNTGRNISNPLIEKMYSSVKHLIKVSENDGSRYLKESYDVIQTLITKKFITYDHKSSIDDFKLYVSELKKYPLVMDIIEMTDGKLTQSYYGNTDKKFAVMKNCVNYIDHMQKLYRPHAKVHLT